MVAQTGRTLLVKLDATGAGSFQTIGGLRTKSFKLDSETVDVTNSDSVNQWRELLANAGVKSAEVSASGVFTDSTYEDDIIAYLMNVTIRDWQIIVPSLGTFQGKFQVSSYENNGEHNGAVEFSFTLMSAGEITFTSV